MLLGFSSQPPRFAWPSLLYNNTRRRRKKEEMQGANPPRLATKSKSIENP
jgi:hypothetical protein